MDDMPESTSAIDPAKAASNSDLRLALPLFCNEIIRKTEKGLCNCMK